jgi:acetyl-CoA acetyltransferase
MMTRDNSPNPWLQEHLPALYMPMGETAEVVAKRYGITRESQDEYALVSQQRTAKAQSDGFFAGEIVPMPVRRARIDPRTNATIAEEDQRRSGQVAGRHHPRRSREAPAVFDTTSGHAT